MLMLLDMWHMSAEPALRRLGGRSKVSSERSTHTHNNTITKATINDDDVMAASLPSLSCLVDGVLPGGDIVLGFPCGVSAVSYSAQ